MPGVTAFDGVSSNVNMKTKGVDFFSRNRLEALVLELMEQAEKLGGAGGSATAVAVLQAVPSTIPAVSSDATSSGLSVRGFGDVGRSLARAFAQRPEALSEISCMCSVGDVLLVSVARNGGRVARDRACGVLGKMRSLLAAELQQRKLLTIPDGKDACRIEQRIFKIIAFTLLSELCTGIEPYQKNMHCVCAGVGLFNFLWVTDFPLFEPNADDGSDDATQKRLGIIF